MKAINTLYAVFLLFALYPAAACATSTDAKQLVGHGGPVNSVSISPDGSRIISGSLDYSVMLWDIGNPKPSVIQRFSEHRGSVSEVMFLPSGHQALSSGDDGTVYLWDTERQSLLHRFNGHEAKVVSLDIDANASILASASWDGTIRLWDLKQRKPLRKIQVHKQTVHSVLLSADGKRVYSAGFDGRIRSFNAENGQFIKVLHHHGWPVNIMRWLPGRERIVFGTTNGDVQIFDTNSARISKVLIPHFKPVLGLVVSQKHGILATGGNDGVIRVWNIDDWSVTSETDGIPGPVWALAFSGDGDGLYFGSLDDNISYWDFRSKQQPRWSQNRKQRRFQVKSGLPPGQLQFARKCSVCHNLKPGKTNRAGPSLYKLNGRKAGSLPDYPYSPALQSSGVVWDKHTIEKLFVDGPDRFVPGSKMPLQTIPDAKKRAALIEYLTSP